VSPEGTGAAGVRFRDAAGCRSLDNVLWHRGPDSSACYRIEGSFPFDEGASDYNDLYSSGPGAVARVNDTLYTELGDWQQYGLGQDVHSISRDPEFDSSGDFHLASGSPCRDSGIPIPGLDFDLDGDPRNPATPDIGADEFGPDAVGEESSVRSRSQTLVVGQPVGRIAFVRFSLGRAAEVRLRVYDVSGRALLATEPQFLRHGRHEVPLDFEGLTAGVYLIDFRAAHTRATAKVVKGS
jgi:hypothetical protein